MHVPVLLKEVIDYLTLEEGDIILDATLGGGGHAEEILKIISPGGILIGVDRDPEALDRTGKRLEKYKGQIILVNDNFCNISAILNEEKIDGIDGAVFDLGVSSYQLDDAEKGFSFLQDGPLDMRFDKNEGFSASHVVNKFSKSELAEIFKEYGEERHSKLIAAAIFNVRKKTPVTSTGELVEIIKKTVGRKYSRQKIHPAARTFQALRIFVNNELDSIENGLNECIKKLNQGARMCVISFHSLEDRIVKNIFRDKDRAGEIKRINKKPVIPDYKEIKDNKRSRSAKLRVAEKV